MAYDYLIDKRKEDAERKSLADHIRAKGGTSEKLSWGEGFEAAVDAIQTGPKDPHTLLLLHGETLKDASKYGVQITNQNVEITEAESKFGGKSMHFNGTDAMLFFPQEAAILGDKDFTIDWWERPELPYSPNAGTRYSSCFEPGEKLGGFLVGFIDTLVFASSNSLDWDILNSAAMLDSTANTWTHWALVRANGTLTSYKNGKKFSQVPFSGKIYSDPANPQCIGGFCASAPAPFKGYMDEFRISDVARWTTDFTPPDKPYDNIAGLKKEESGHYTASENGSVTVKPRAGTVFSDFTIVTHVTPDLARKRIVNNGVFYATDEQLDGYSVVDVEVPGQVKTGLVWLDVICPFGYMTLDENGELVWEERRPLSGTITMVLGSCIVLSKKALFGNGLYTGECWKYIPGHDNIAILVNAGNPNVPPQITN